MPDPAVSGNIVVPTAGGPTLRVNAGFTANGQTIKTFVVKQALSASATTTVPLEAVTTGKTLVITDIYIGWMGTVQAEDVQITAAGTPIFRGVCKGDTAPIQMPGMESQPNASSGQQVNLVFPAVTGAPNGYAFIGGFEQ
jgi:hypothetical protein